MSINGPGDLRDTSFFCPSVITREPACQEVLFGLEKAIVFTLVGTNQLQIRGLVLRLDVFYFRNLLRKKRRSM